MRKTLEGVPNGNDYDQPAECAICGPLDLHVAPFRPIFIGVDVGGWFSDVGRGVRPGKAFRPCFLRGQRIKD